VVFVDTSAWFAAFVEEDPRHAVCRSLVDTREGQLVTTDYVIDELLTLLSARGHHDVALTVGTVLWGELICDLAWVGPDDTDEAWRLIRTFTDKRWSFTDCTSYAVMQRLGVREALSLDDHFRQFGFVSVEP
jgi:uncharacterized protein